MATLRRCAGCRERRPKDELWRFVLPRVEPTQPVPDFLARRPGRGAYTCPRHACVRRAVERGGFARSFRRPLGGRFEMIWSVLSQVLSETIDAEVARMVGDGRVLSLEPADGRDAQGSRGVGPQHKKMTWGEHEIVISPGPAAERLARLVAWMAAFRAADETNRE